MNLNHLAIFYAVAQERSVSLGAERLHISQPAVSKQLKEFEQGLNVKLFDRHAKGVQLTEAGQLLRGYAQRIFDLEAEAELAIGELRGLVRGHLKVGASLTIGNYILPDFLAAFHSRYPGIDLEVEIANTEVIQNKLLAGELHVALTEGYVENAQLEASIFREDELVAIAPPGHPILHDRPVSFERLCQERFVLRERGSGTREVMERAFAARGATIAEVMSLGDIEAVKRAIAAGIGIGMVSISAIDMELALGRVVRVAVDGFRVLRPFHVINNRGKYLTHAARAFMQIIKLG